MKPNWLTRLFFTLTTVTLVVLGFFFLTVALVVGAVVALVLGVRLWWTMRKLKREHGSFTVQPMAQGKTVVEGEFQVVEQESRTGKLSAPASPDSPAPPASSNTPPAP